MKEILNLKTLEKELSKRWRMVSDSDNKDQLKAISEYLCFIKGQYETGVLGYMAYPYYVASLLAIDNIEDYKELEEILDLAAKLEIPNPDSPTNPKARLDETENLSLLIEGFEGGLSGM